MLNTGRVKPVRNESKVTLRGNDGLFTLDRSTIPILNRGDDSCQNRNRATGKRREGGRGREGKSARRRRRRRGRGRKEDEDGEGGEDENRSKILAHNRYWTTRRTDRGERAKTRRDESFPEFARRRSSLSFRIVERYQKTRRIERKAGWRKGRTAFLTFRAIPFGAQPFFCLQPPSGSIVLFK